MYPQLAFSRRLDAPAGRVWRLITDTQTWPQWGPSLRAIDSSNRFIRAGSTGRVQTVAGLWLPYTVGAFQPGQYWDWRVGGVAATGHRVEALGTKRCRLSFTVPAWAVAYGLVCRLALARIDRSLKRQGKQLGA
jgi:Polyketide cyclase / dehydrase and lipid transport